MRLIDADAIKYKYMLNNCGFAIAAEQKEINRMPTVDAVPVIRCKGCKHLTHTPHKWYCPINRKVVGRDEFCCWAERKSE